MFDFENTPITHTTLLKAQYNCGPESPVSYFGQWAKITLNNGHTLEVTSQAELNSLLTSTTTATVAGSTVSVADIKSIAFGTDVTALPDRTCQLDSWSSLTSVKGFHEGLKTIGNYCFTVANGGGWGNLADNTIILPSTLTSVGQLLLCACGDPNLTVIVNCPVSVFSATNPNYLLSAYEPGNPQYVNGVKISGRYAAEFIAKYPNRSTAPYRNIYNASTFDEFFEALDAGFAQDFYPPGSKLPDVIGRFNVNWIVMDYMTQTDASGKKVPGVVLMPEATLVPEQRFPPTSGYIYDYGQSYVHAYLHNSMLPIINKTIADRITEIQLPYLYNSAIHTVNAKLWIMSVKEVQGVLADGAGQPFAYWKEIVPTATNNNVPARRVLNLAISASQFGSYWLRDTTGTATIYYVAYDNGRIPSATNVTSPGGIQFCAFFQSDGVGPLSVTFDTNGGTPQPARQRVAEGGFVKKPRPNPSRPNADFLGWYNGETEFDFANTPITQNITLKAKYRFNVPEVVTTVEDVKACVEAGVEVPVGTEIEDTYGGVSNPLIVMQNLNSSNNSVYGGAEGVILMRKYATDYGVQFNSSATASNYANSNIYTYLQNTYLSKCSDNLKAMLSNISVPCYNTSRQMVQVTGKWFLPSAYELCSEGANGAAGYEGIIWQYWKDATGFSAPMPMYTENNAYKITNTSNTPQLAWSRSNYGTSAIVAVDGSYGWLLTGIGGYLTANGTGISMAPACFIGKD